MGRIKVLLSIKQPPMHPFVSWSPQVWRSNCALCWTSCLSFDALWILNGVCGDYVAHPLRHYSCPTINPDPLAIPLFDSIKCSCIMLSCALSNNFPEINCGLRSFHARFHFLRNGSWRMIKKGFSERGSVNLRLSTDKASTIKLNRGPHSIFLPDFDPEIYLGERNDEKLAINFDISL